MNIFLFPTFDPRNTLCIRACITWQTVNIRKYQSILNMNIDCKMFIFPPLKCAINPCQSINSYTGALHAVCTLNILLNSICRSYVYSWSHSYIYFRSIFLVTIFYTRLPASSIFVSIAMCNHIVKVWDQFRYFCGNIYIK